MLPRGCSALTYELVVDEQSCWLLIALSVTQLDCFRERHCDDDSFFSFLEVLTWGLVRSLKREREISGGWGDLVLMERAGERVEALRRAAGGRTGGGWLSSRDQYPE